MTYSQKVELLSKRIQDLTQNSTHEFLLVDLYLKLGPQRFVTILRELIAEDQAISRSLIKEHELGIDERTKTLSGVSEIEEKLNEVEKVVGEMFLKLIDKMATFTNETIIILLLVLNVLRKLVLYPTELRDQVGSNIRYLEIKSNKIFAHITSIYSRLPGKYGETRGTKSTLFVCFHLWRLTPM